MANIHTLGDSTLDNLYWLLIDGDLEFAKKIASRGNFVKKGIRSQAMHMMDSQQVMS